MNEAEYKEIEKYRDLITAENLSCKENRTLLYGYTSEREIFHVYLKDCKIHVVVYKNAVSEIREIKVTGNYDYRTSKRLYPEKCDYEFCKLLKCAGENPLFGAWEGECEFKEVFYGRILR